MLQFTQDAWQRKIVGQRIKTVFFFTETRSVVFTQRWFHAHFQIWWAASFKTMHKLYNQFNNNGSVLERKCHQPSFVCSLENFDIGQSVTAKKCSAVKSVPRHPQLKFWYVSFSKGSVMSPVSQDYSLFAKLQISCVNELGNVLKKSGMMAVTRFR
jgi:hypothetical protein